MIQQKIFRCSILCAFLLKASTGHAEKRLLEDTIASSCQTSFENDHIAKQKSYTNLSTAIEPPVNKTFFLFYDYVYPSFIPNHLITVKTSLGYFGDVLDVTSAAEATLIFVLPYLKNGTFYKGEYSNKLVIGVSAEAYVYDPAIVNLSLSFPHIKTENYLRFPYYANFAFSPETLLHKEKLYKEKREFCGFLVSNYHQVSLYKRKYDGVLARDSLFKKLSAYKLVKSGGKHLNNIGFLVPKHETKRWLSQFKFIICYENQSYDGYVTEKVFNAYNAGAIPIYYADRSVLQDINPRAIIFAPDFESEEALIEYIVKVDTDDALYRSIWDEPLMVDPYYSSDAYQQRLREKLAKHIIPYL